MDRIIEQLEVANHALATLNEALAIDVPSKLERDGAIQRFEYTFESCWKVCQRYLLDHEGLTCASPKSCFRYMGEVGLLEAEETVQSLQMTDDRNRTVHIYNESIAEEIFSRLKEYASLCGKLLNSIHSRITHNDLSGAT